MQNPGTRRERALRAAALAIAPALALAVLYAPALDNPLIWTDADAIGRGTMLRRPGEIAAAFRQPLHRVEGRGDTLQQAYYRPVQVVALSLVDRAAEREPRLFRIFTLGIAAACASAWGFTAWALLGAFAPALLVALAVAVHPVGIETIVWVAGVSEPLCALFLIVSLALAAHSSTRTRLRSAVGVGALSLLALLMALLSKERAVVAPALLAAMFLAAPVARAAPRRAVVLVTLHAILALGVLFVLRPLVIGSAIVAPAPIDGSFATQLWTALAQWPANLGWLFVPWQSTTSDVVHVVRTAASPGPWLGAGLAAVSVVAWAALLRAGRPAAAVGLAWIWIAFLPTSGILPMLHLRAERYLYLSAFGAALLVADLVWASRGRIADGARLAAPVLLGLWVALLAQRTWARLPDWESTHTLMASAVAADPAYREGRFLIALHHHETGRYAEADAAMASLLAPRDPFPETASYLNTVSLYELACANRLAQGRYADALALGRGLTGPMESVARMPTFRTCLGQAHAALGEREESLVLWLGVARELGPETPPRLFVMIARSYLRLSKLERARAWLDRAEASGDPALAAPIQRLRAKLVTP